MSDSESEIPDNILQEDDVEGPFKGKIGTFTPKLIWIHKDDISNPSGGNPPVSEGDEIRFTETDPAEKHSDWGSKQTGGKIDEVRDTGVEYVLFITESAMVAERLMHEDTSTEVC